MTRISYLTQLTFSIYRTYGIQSEQKYLIRIRTRENKTIALRIGACESPFFNYGEFAIIKIFDNKKAHLSMSFNDFGLG